MELQAQNIPQQLKSLSQWVVFAKNTKIPISCVSGVKADLTKSTDWVSFAEAYRYFYSNLDKIGGVGFVLANDYIVIDFDNNNQLEQGNVKDEFLIKLNSYAEVSQSGNGIHIFCRAKLSKGNRLNEEFNIKILEKGTFVIMTGEILPNITQRITETSVVMKQLYQKYFYKEYEETYSLGDSADQSEEELEDETIINLIKVSRQSDLYYKLSNGDYQLVGFKTKEEACKVLCQILAFWCNGNSTQIDRIFRTSKLFSKKWDEQQGQFTYGQGVIANAIQSCSCFYNSQTFNANDYIFNNETGEVKYVKHYPLDDTGNAMRIYDNYKSVLKYNADDNLFMIYDKHTGTWQRDDRQRTKVKQFADSVLEDMRKELLTETLQSDETLLKNYQKNVKYFASRYGKDSALNELQHLGNLPCHNTDFDKDDFLLNTLDGVLNLKSGELLQHNPFFMCSRNTNCHVDLEHEPVLFKKFISETFLGKPDVINYVHKLLGYTLTGSTIEQIYMTCQGYGNDGKSVMFNVYGTMLGDYATNMRIESICEKQYANGNGPTPDIAELCGKRFIRTNESNGKFAIDESLIKQLTGGDPITARKLHAESFTFFSKGKIWILCNEPLKILGTTRGDWRRVVKLDFLNSVPDEKIDKLLESKLMSELPKILGWCVKGCIKWQKEGLEMPQEIINSIKQYRTDNDVIGKFIENECVFGPFDKYKIQAGELFKAYKERARMSNEDASFTQTKFGREMMKHAIDSTGKELFKKSSNHSKKMYYGITLEKHNPQYSFDIEDFEEDNSVNTQLVNNTYVEPKPKVQDNYETVSLVDTGLNDEKW